MPVYLTEICQEKRLYIVTGKSKFWDISKLKNQQILSLFWMFQISA
jgi:hypothetical protein